MVMDGFGDLLRGDAGAGVDELVNLVFGDGSVLLKMAANGVGQDKRGS